MCVSEHEVEQNNIIISTVDRTVYFNDVINLLSIHLEGEGNNMMVS